MHIKSCILLTGLLLTTSLASIEAHSQEANNLGQVIKIHTDLDSYIGKPSWLIIIRDVDHNQNIPYLYDFTLNNNFWISLTYGHHYTIMVSEMKMNIRDRKISNFCGLENMGVIQRGVSYNVLVTGKLTGNPDLVSCKVMKYSGTDFNIGTED